MTPEDEEFERILREIRRNAVEDDDIQDYKKPWVGLTDDERYKLWLTTPSETENRFAFAKAIETELKRKNF